MKFNRYIFTSRKFGLALAAGAVIAAGCQTTPTVQPQNLADDAVQGFVQTEPVRVYNEETLFEYINGEAEIYLSRGFRKLYVLTYKAQHSGREYAVDAYDLGTPKNAADTHAHFKTRHSEPISGLEQLATTDGLSVDMHYDQHFIRIQAVEDVSNPSRNELTNLARGLYAAMR